jgi:hypothetical protein
MSELTRDDGQLLIQMISTWLTYAHPDEMDADHIAQAADLLHRAGVSSGEAEALFEICLPLHYSNRDTSYAQHRVANARFAEFRRVFPEDEGG